MEPSVGILETYGVTFASPSGTGILTEKSVPLRCNAAEADASADLAQHVVRIEDAPLGTEFLDLVLHHRVVKLLADREHSERVLVARLSRELLVGTAVKCHVRHLELAGQALDAQALRAENAAAQDVDVVLLASCVASWSACDASPFGST